MRLIKGLMLAGITAFTLVGCGGGGGGTSIAPNSGCPSNITCETTINGVPTVPPVTAQPFPVKLGITNLAKFGSSATGLFRTPFVGDRVFNISKTPSTSTFNGIQVTLLRTVTNDETFPSYDIYFDKDYNIYGFKSTTLWGLRQTQVQTPNLVNDKTTGNLGNFNVYSDSNLMTLVGSADLTFNVDNCCSLISKDKANLTIELTGKNLNGDLVFRSTQVYVLNLNGAVIFGSEKYFENGKEIQLRTMYGGY